MKNLAYLAAVVVFLCGAETLAAEDPVSFSKQIRPILSDKCFACHGPDANHREADLRLDVAESATAERDGGRVIVPGKPDESLLLERVRSSDPDVVMPPPDRGKPLTPEEVRLLERWISEGAKFQIHWSLRPLTRPRVPPVSAGSAENPIDSFILQQLREHHLDLAPTADARTLVRRVSFDLTGLPPSPSQVAQFERAPSDDAYRELVEELLASPHYGERMAVYWLDLVRYADTLGYHGDQVRSVSPYRDYVIRSFNENKPFDQFTIEQLAGDLLPNATLWQKVASTYNRLNRASAEGGVQPKEYLAKYAADRVRTTGQVWLGSTFGCAECHDHKFDPFTTRDFYRFEAFFADIKEQGIVPGANHIEQLPVPTEDQAAEQKRLKAEIANLEREFQTVTPELTQAQREWEAGLSGAQDVWQSPQPGKAVSEAGVPMTLQPDGTIVVSNKVADKDNYEIVFPAADEPPAAVRLEVLSDPSLPAKGPGRAANGNFVINRVDVTWRGRPLRWDSAISTHDQKGYPASNLVANQKNGWAILPKVGQSHQLILVAKPSGEPNEGEGANELVVRIVQQHGGRHTIGRFRVSVATQKPPGGFRLPNDALASIAALPPDKRTAAQQQQLDAAFRAETPLLAKVRKELAARRSALQQLEKSIVTTLATKATEPRMIRVLPRGNWMDDSGEVVLPGVPHFLPQPEGSEQRRLNRLDLARWLVDRRNPLVARTFVNRIWMLMFGQGLCRTVDDLGSQGEPPLHPELLDWLAVEFIDSGWDVKHIVRLIVMSRTYRQSSLPRAELVDVDPYNRLLARQSRWRLDAEMIRDQALQVSGLLVDRIGGPSVKPYQPRGYWAQLNFPKRTYQHDTGENQYRRGLYTHWQRTFLHPSLLAFDAPPREECTAQRARSNTPLQALVLLNDPTYVEAARVLAAEMIQQVDGEPGERLRWLFRRTLSRLPSDSETVLLEAFLERQRAYYRDHTAAAEELLTVGLAPAPPDADVVEIAAWTGVTRAVLNLHEFITRY